MFHCIVGIDCSPHVMKAISILRTVLLYNAGWESSGCILLCSSCQVAPVQELLQQAGLYKPVACIMGCSCHGAYTGGCLLSLCACVQISSSVCVHVC